MILSSDSSDRYTSTVQSSSSSANAALPPHPHLQTSYPPLAHSVFSLSAALPPSLAPGCPSTPPASSPLLTLSRFSNRMLEVFEPGALNYFTYFRPILLILSGSRIPIFTHLPLSGFLVFLVCIVIAPTPGLAFSPMMSRTLAAVSSLSSGRAYFSLNFLSRLFQREQLASTPEPPLPKRNKPVCPEHQIVKRAFSVRELKRVAEERERDDYFSAEEQ